MPGKQNPSKQPIKYTAAMAIANSLLSVGVPIAQIREIDPAIAAGPDSEYVVWPVPDDDWSEDDGLYQYVADGMFGGAGEQELGLIAPGNGGWNFLFDLAQKCLVDPGGNTAATAANAYAAVIALPGVAAALDAALAIPGKVPLPTPAGPKPVPVINSPIK